jgi:ATP-dependent DNA helicase Q1
MGEILKLSREEYEFINRRDPNYPVATGSKAVSSTPTRSVESESHRLNDRIAEIDRDISKCDQKIEELQTQRALWASERDQLLGKLRQLPLSIPSQSLSSASSVNRKGKGKETENSIDYHLEAFEWSRELKTTMKRVFNIDDFRLCQRG